MAMLKCKMCGGNLEVSEGTTVCECEYCGTNQTVPKAQDDVTANLFNRANNLRIKCEFDKAQEIYEKIVSANPNESEAYWGIVLCKFGIEYVEDPATFKKIPTCHRTQLESVQTDVDYKAAIDNADSIQRTLYESEAAEIDRLQRDILAIVHNEEPFDVFICYKETDENGKRTNDSVIANDIYHQLTQEGFKVFYAAITLEDKLGQAYEPYIFAALTSAKVMLAIGSKPEYFNAVWVKNEWSRYLKIMKNDRSKLLIPCYKDMDAYDLPEEFSHLQAQDMSKIGFINDVIRGIKKVIVKEEAPVVQHTVVNNVSASASANVENLLKRGFLELEMGNWEKADSLFERVLDENAENGNAYLGKLMVELKVSTESNLKNCIDPFCESNNYKNAYRFGSDEQKVRLTEYISFIRERQEKARLSEIEYEEAKKQLRKLNTKMRELIQKEKDCEQAGLYKYIPKEESVINQRLSEIESESLNTVTKLNSLINEYNSLGFFAFKRRREIEEERVEIEKKFPQFEVEKQKLEEEKQKLVNVSEALAIRKDLAAVREERRKYNEVINGFYNTQKANLKQTLQKDTIKKGYIIRLGNYNWKILEKTDHNALIITEECIEKKEYTIGRSSNAWRKCLLRNYLNGEFFNNFTDEEKEMISTTTVISNDNSGKNTTGKFETADKVFLLSVEEAEKFFPSNNDRKAYFDGEKTQWWLRSVGNNTNNPIYINTNGSINDDYVFEKIGVRPAMYIEF